jgi:hypothetical protein
MKPDERCEGITAAGEQCRCYAAMRVNDIPYCFQHAQKELRAVAIEKPVPLGEKPGRD